MVWAVDMSGTNYVLPDPAAEAMTSAKSVPDQAQTALRPRDRVQARNGVEVVEDAG